MAQFNANIDLDVNSTNALRGVKKVEQAFDKLNREAAKFTELFGTPKVEFALKRTVVQLVAIDKALRAQKTAAAEFNAELLRTQRILSRSQGRQRALPAARGSAGALPAGRVAGLLPAAGGTGAGSNRAMFDRAAATARAIDQAAYREATKGSIRAAEELTGAIEAEVSARRKAARAVTERTEKANTAAQKLLPPASSPVIPAGGPASPLGVNTSGNPRKQQILQKEVDRQIRVTGKLSNELLETVAKYNKVQTSADRLVKTQGRLSTELVKETKKKGGRGGGGGAGGGLAAGIGFPLLFGGGPGSVIGGALGSAGGFGTQILASAIGGIIDQAVAGVAKLGQALNPLTADIDAVVAAAGESGTAFGQLVKDLEKVAGKEKALAAATAQLATVIGQKGVSALREFGQDTADLSSEFNIAMSQMSAAVADLINFTGVLKGLTSGIERGNLLGLSETEGDPRIKALREELDRTPFGTSKEGTKGARQAIEDKIVALQKELQLEQQINLEKETGVAIAEAKTAASNVDINLLKAEIALAESGLDLTTEAGVALAEKVIEQQTYVAIQAAINQGLSTEAALLKETLEKLQLKARAAAAVEAANRKAEAAARKAANDAKRLAREAEQARKKEQQTLQTISQLDLKNYDIAIQTVRATEGEVAAIKEQLSNMDALLAKRIEVINLSNKDQRIKDIEVALAEKQIALEQITLRNKKQEIELQRELNKLKAEQQVDAIQTGLDQELAGLSLGGNDQTDLLQEQSNRYANTLKDINNQIEQQNLLIENTPTPNQEVINAATTQLDTLQKTKSAYEAMLPQIFAAEQAQLKYNQAFAAINPAVNSLVSGLRDVVAGTKTAEEAFADFLNTVADQLIQTAATMIAQYIAIGIAKAFAFGGNSPIRGASPSALTGAGASMANMLMPPGRATGGTAEGGQPYIVGEEGPELFIPGVTGTVTNNDQFEAARNAMSGGSSPGADGSVSSDSAGVSSAFAENTSSITTTNSYMRERSMERSSQTTVGGGGSLVVETQVINNVEYATVEQMQLASAASAKQARAEVFRDLRNKPAARASVGMR